MIYKLISITEFDEKIYAKIDDDGVCRCTCSEKDPEFIRWIEEGNTPEPADKLPQE